MARKIKAPPGLDYDPVMGAHPNLSFGVARAEGTNGLNATRFIAKRLFPVSAPKDWSSPWPAPTCYRHDVLLPVGASDDLVTPRRLVEAYDDQSFGDVKDLAIIVTLRFPEVDEPADPIQLHSAWETGRAFGMKLVRTYGAPTIAIMHVPARAARLGAPHIHLMLLARQLLPSGFGKFVRPLLADDGRDLVDGHWTDLLDRTS